MEQEKEGTSTGFLVDSWDKLMQDGSCLKGTVKSRLIMVPKGAKWSFALELNWKLPPVVNSTLGPGGGYSEALSYAGSASPSCVSLLAGTSKSLIGWPHGSSMFSLIFGLQVLETADRMALVVSTVNCTCLLCILIDILSKSLILYLLTICEDVTLLSELVEFHLENQDLFRAPQSFSIISSYLLLCFSENLTTCNRGENK